MLYGAERLDAFYTTLRAEVSPQIQLRFGMQSNATAVTEDILRVLYRHRVKVGVSLDGPPAANQNRIDHAGRETHGRIVRGIEQLRDYGDSRLLAGILTVVDTSADPVLILDHIGSLRPKQIDLMQHFGTHDNPPPGVGAGSADTPFATWMLRAFHHWISLAHLQPIRIRIFEDAMALLLGGRPSSDWLGLAPVSYAIVQTDGGIEGSDMLKIAGTEGRVLGLNVESNSFDDALARPEIQMRQGGKDRLCCTCRECSLVDVCGGGYFPTRYRAGTGYQNPSVYCNDLKVLLSGIREYVHLSLGLPIPPKVEPQPQMRGRRALALIEGGPGDTCDPRGHGGF